MISIDESSVRALLPWPELVEALRRLFVSGCESPPRLHYQVPTTGQPPATLLLMPAWVSGAYIGVKLVNIFPANGALDMPVLSSLYVLADGVTGQMLAYIDGGELTARRTAAASVLAASFLARHDAATLLVVGTGRVCRNLAKAYCAVRPIERILVYGRSLGKAASFVRNLESVLPATLAVADNLKRALADADIVTSATLAIEPMIHGADLPPGIHVDLVGGFRPDMREADNAAITRANAIFVDTRPGALSEAGDIMQPIEQGVIEADSIAADLAELCRGDHPGRRDDDEVTLFKSVGASIEDLAAAIALFKRYSGQTIRGRTVAGESK